jgi:hypothetical protein
MTQVWSPWTDEEVEFLRQWQARDDLPHFNSTDRNPDGSKHALIPTTRGWVRDLGGPVVQTWAHDFMLKPLPPEPCGACAYLTGDFGDGEDTVLCRDHVREARALVRDLQQCVLECRKMGDHEHHDDLLARAAKFLGPEEPHV